MSKREVIKSNYGTIIATYHEPTAKPKVRVQKHVSLSTLDRRMQIIAKWERLRYITPAKAKSLREELVLEINL